jgi:membrane protease YdiL (CAAX protease family)
MKSLKSILFTLLFITIYIASNIIIPIAVYGAYLFLYFFKNYNKAEFNFNKLNENALNFITENTIILTLIVSVFSFFLFFLVQKIRKENLIQKCQFKSISIYNILFCIFFATLLNYVIDIFLRFLSSLQQMTKYMESYEKLMDSIIFENSFWISIFVVGIFAPIFEEIMLRGLIQNELKKGFNIYLAIFIQAILFGLIHGNLIQSSYAFILGAVIGLTYYLSNSIWTPIIIHATINLQSTILSNETIQSYFLKLINLIPYTNYIIIFICFILSSLLGFILFKNEEFSFTNNNIIKTSD